MSAPRPTFTLAEIAARLGGRVLGSAPGPISGVATLEEAGPGDIAFLANPKYRSKVAGSRAGAVIVAPRESEITAAARIVAENPYAYFARTVALFHPARVAIAGIHPSAVVHAGARIDASAEIGPHAVVEAGAVIGPRARLGAGCFVGEGAKVGADTHLNARVTVYHGCEIGERCILHSGAVVGADGFGMASDAGRWVKFPQVGRAIVGDDVEIGANSTVDRGALGDTVIEEGVKIDNQVQVAHNCRVGAHTVIAGCAGISGSAVIGRHCVIGGGAGLVGHIVLCDGVTVSGMTLITKSITQPGVYTSGAPFMPHAEWLRNAAPLRKLDDIARQARGRAPGEKPHGPDVD